MMNRIFLLVVFTQGIGVVSGAEERALSQEERDALVIASKQTFERAEQAIARDPKATGGYSLRGDVHFFRGEFGKAVADYDQMVTLDESQDASHWRRGIALFYVEEYDKAAAQFGRYHSFDNVDRENGIWRYLCQYKSAGKEQAQKELLKYDKDDREPFPDVYKLFAGERTPKQILDGINAAEIDDVERQKRLFYAQLYIGLFEHVEGRDESARSALLSATKNKWPRRAGYGPNYMWHVGRLHFEKLRQTAEMDLEEK